jgi:hypothetical protein
MNNMQKPINKVFALQGDLWKTPGEVLMGEGARQRKMKHSSLTLVRGFQSKKA